MLINALPIHIFYQIFSHVLVNDIWEMRQVCKSWNTILKSQEYWTTRIGHRFGDTAIPQFHVFCNEFGRDRNTFQTMYDMFFNWRQKLCTFTAYFPPGFFVESSQLHVRVALMFSLYLDGRSITVGYCKLRKTENNAYSLYAYCSSGGMLSNDTIKQRLLHADAIVTPGWWGNTVETFHVIIQGEVELPQPDLGVPIQAITWYK